MAALDALLESVQLKSLPRAGWVRAGVPSPESVAAHSWGVSWLVVALLPDELDRARALTYAALHDLPEVRAGDITPHDGVEAEEKARREHAAMDALATSLGRPDLLATWERYEAQADAEARFVRQLDRLDMALQALAQHEDGAAGMAEFIASADRFIDDARLRPWMEQITTRLGG
jgi:putative hydrolase of HD superfamily